MNIVINEDTDILTPGELVEQARDAFYDSHGKPETKAPPFVGFLCFCCGERHAELRDLLNCHEVRRLTMASAPVLVLAEVVA